MQFGTGRLLGPIDRVLDLEQFIIFFWTSFPDLSTRVKSGAGNDNGNSNSELHSSDAQIGPYG